jgi:histidinol-phosphatase (PHP family)
MLPFDGHVHSEWSWDATDGSMREACRRAEELGLDGIAFTEHVDLGAWAVLMSDLADYPHLRQFVVTPRPAGDPVGGMLQPPPLDLKGYRHSIEQCRETFPHLSIVAGIEVGEPHWHQAEVSELLRAEPFERVVGSLHCLRTETLVSEMPNMFREHAAADVVRDYLAEVVRLIDGSSDFEILGHIDYVLRYWPESAGPFVLARFEEEFRYALRTLARSRRVLEINTRTRLHPEIVHWWREEGGESVAFGSDAHSARGVAHAFEEAAEIASAAGFERTGEPDGFWRVPRIQSHS